MCRVRWASLGWAFALVCAALPARAEPAGPTYSLSWVRGEGAEACPTARALASEVERRLGRAVFDAAAMRSFEVQVTRGAGQYRSDVFVRDEAGRALGHRTLQSDEPGCSALFGATALAIALVIDPEAAGRQPAATAAFEAPPAPPPPVVVEPPPPVVAEPPPVLVAPSPPPALPVPAPRALVTFALRGQLAGGLVPEPAPGIGLGFAARPGKRWGFAAAAWYTPPKRALRGQGDFEIGLTRASLALTFDAAGTESVRLVLAAGPTLGAFHLAVRTPAPVTDAGDFAFLAAELGASLQIAVSQELFVELGGAGLVPLRPQSFSVRDQAEPVWEEPVFAGAGHLGLGARFP